MLEDINVSKSKKLLQYLDQVRNAPKNHVHLDLGVCCVPISEVDQNPQRDVYQPSADFDHRLFKAEVQTHVQSV